MPSKSRKKNNSTELLSLIAESCVRTSNVFDKALQKSTFIVLHNFLINTIENYPYTRKTFDIYYRSQGLLNRKDTTYDKYCEELLEQMASIVIYKHKLDTKNFVRWVNSVFTKMEENKLIWQNVNHILLSKIGELYLLKHFIETGHFCPSFDELRTSPFHYATGFIESSNIAKYYISINFFNTEWHLRVPMVWPLFSWRERVYLGYVASGADTVPHNSGRCVCHDWPAAQQKTSGVCLNEKVLYVKTRRGDCQNVIKEWSGGQRGAVLQNMSVLLPG